MTPCGSVFGRFCVLSFDRLIDDANLNLLLNHACPNLLGNPVAWYSDGNSIAFVAGISIVSDGSSTDAVCLDGSRGARLPEGIDR